MLNLDDIDFMNIDKDLMPIAIIPARGGSKRIKNKNIKDFCGRALISYSIKAAFDSGIFSRVIVSTDDESIASVAISYGADIIDRPKELADDFTSSSEAVMHSVSVLKEQGVPVRYICTIYATAPMLSLRPNLLRQAYERLKTSGGARQVFSATDIPFPIWRSFGVDKNGRCKMFFPEYFSARSQDLPQAYGDAGQFYFEDLSAEFKVGFNSDKIAFILPRYMVCDIDTPEDWEMAKILYELNKRLIDER